ncbi:unnamed protein product [Brachionus calyciflorus]|uniref:SGF29 C-terminal domain-containing protein n=1 Tax=Brachionus calyciflorus TaxID=104777 RepID=A0A813N7L0_9BILA|nr:unnamed protein product [Brachionus calyciflorus]
MKGKRGKGAKETSMVNSNVETNPVTFYQDSCSNDTNFSTISNQNQKQNPIFQNESKIRSLLKELQVHVKNCQNQRDKNNPNLLNIEKTHEKLKSEEKVTPFYRKKLKSMYATSLKESENEIRSLRRALDCINQIRLTQNEIRILQHQSFAFSGSKNQQNDQSIKPSLNMRRGVLMSILQQAALTLPLWVGEIGQSAPPLCGSIPPESQYICKQGDKVAAKVKSNSSSSNASTSSSSNGKKNKNLIEEKLEEEEENWILAEVVSFNNSTGKYEVDDVDSEEGHERHVLGKRRIVPLPLWRANPLTDSNAIFPKDSLVLALYPQTTCFYRGIVSESPQTPQEDYLILFEDNTYPEGYSPPLNVPQLYVVADKNSKK